MDADLLVSPLWHHPIGLLNFSAHTEEHRGFGERGVAIEDLLPDDQIDETGLVFEREEGDAGRGAWALSADHHADVVELVQRIEVRLSNGVLVGVGGERGQLAQGGVADALAHGCLLGACGSKVMAERCNILDSEHLFVAGLLAAFAAAG